MPITLTINFLDIKWVCLYVFIIIALASGKGFSQEDPLITESDNKFVKKLRRKVPRPKFFILEYIFLKDVHVNATSPELGESSSNIRINERYALKLRAPIILKPKYTFLGGFNLKKELFDFENSQGVESAYYNVLDRRILSSVGVSLILKKDISEKKFMYAFWNGTLNSDNISFSEIVNQLKTTIVFSFVKNVNPVTQIGYGGAFGYIFGGPSVFPVFIYNQTYSEMLNVEMMLPKSAKLRYTFSPEMYLMLIAEVNGASYFLKDATVEGINRVTFQRSAFTVKTSFEREIYDWIWFGVTAGYNLPINLYVAEPRKRRKDAIITLDADPSFIFEFSIFAVVPKNIFYKKAKSR